MKAASLNELKKELQTRNPEEWMELCLRMARFKKENKELLSFILFMSDDENAYVTDVKAEMEFLFSEVNTNTFYKANKSLRKVLKYTNKQCRYSGSKTVECELLLHFCKKFSALKIQIKNSTILVNLWNGQIAKIEKAISLLHEDLQYDYRRELEKLGTAILK